MDSTFKLRTGYSAVRNFKLIQFTALGLYVFLCYLMLKITMQYIPYNSDVAFLRIKQDVIDVPYYKLAFFTHVYTAIMVLPAGFTQFSSYIRRNFVYLHKTTGWIYATVVILLQVLQDFIWVFTPTAGGSRKFHSVFWQYSGSISLPWQSSG